MVFKMYQYTYKISCTLSSHIPKQLFEGDLCSQDKRDKILGNIRAMLTARSGVGDTSILYPINYY